MATEPAGTTNYGFPQSVNGTVALKRSVKTGFQSVDTVIAALAARVTALEADVLALQGGLNDSNSQFFTGDPG